MDDCCNIHGNYLRCKQVLNPNTALLTFVHQNITVQNNHFEMNDRRILKAAYCKNLRFVNNTFTHNPALPNQGEQGSGFLTEKLFDCTIEPLKEK